MINSAEQKQSEIEAAIAEISSNSSHHWTRLGNLLVQVEKNGYWRDDSKNFTEWMSKHCADFDVKQTVLWSHLRMARYYTETMYPNLFRWGIVAPKSVLQLPRKVKREVLEMYSKIANIAPDSVSEVLAKRVLDGTVKRSELRSLWQAYRHEVNHEPNRAGRYSTAMMSSAKDMAQKNRNAQLLAALSDNDDWLKKSELSAALPYKLMPAIRFAQEQAIIAFDLLLLVAADTGITELHGIELFDAHQPNYEALEILSSYVDLLWLAVADDFAMETEHEELAGYGLLQVKQGTITARFPKEYSSGSHVLTTTRVLLEKMAALNFKLAKKGGGSKR